MEQPRANGLDPSTQCGARFLGRHHSISDQIGNELLGHELLGNLELAVPQCSPPRVPRDALRPLSIDSHDFVPSDLMLRGGY
jgi:hypothetical protein